MIATEDKNSEQVNTDKIDRAVEPASKLKNAGVERVARFSSTEGYFTLSCLGVSIVCLVLHLLATFLSPHLQSLAAACLASLAAALLAAYVSFLANMLGGAGLGADSCRLLAVLMFYCYL